MNLRHLFTFFIQFADENFQIIRKMVEDVGNMFENANQSMVPKSHNNRYDDEEVRVRLQDMDKVRNVTGRVTVHSALPCLVAVWLLCTQQSDSWHLFVTNTKVLTNAIIWPCSFNPPSL